MAKTKVNNRRRHDAAKQMESKGTFLLDSYIEKKIGNVGSGKAYYQSGPKRAGRLVAVRRRPAPIPLRIPASGAVPCPAAAPPSPPPPPPRLRSRRCRRRHRAARAAARRRPRAAISRLGSPATLPRSQF